MKVTTQTNKDIETNETNIQLKEEDIAVLNSANMPFAQFLSQINGDNQINNNNLFSVNIDYNYDSLDIDIEDAMFFVNLTQNGQFNVEVTQNGNFQNLIKTETNQNLITQKTVNVTNQLTELIEKAQSTQKPVRITFDNDVSVILKIDKHGKVTAEFIPGSAEVENYLKNNIASLRQKFDEQNLPYNDLLYRQNNKQNKNRNQNSNNQKGDK